MDRKSIVPIALMALLLVVACAKKAPVVVEPEPEPETVEAPPTTDVSTESAPAGPVDVEEEKPPMSLQEIQQNLESRGLLGDVFYEFDKYDLRPDARERLAKNAEFMKSSEGSKFTFRVEGHCDERGTNEYNIALGQNRWQTSVDYLATLGIPANRFEGISYGEERPFCTESSEACWQRNRRARFVITGER